MVRGRSLLREHPAAGGAEDAGQAARRHLLRHLLARLGQRCSMDRLVAAHRRIRRGNPCPGQRPGCDRDLASTRRHSPYRSSEQVRYRDSRNAARPIHRHPAPIAYPSNQSGHAAPHRARRWATVGDAAFHPRRHSPYLLDEGFPWVYIESGCAARTPPSGRGEYLTDMASAIRLDRHACGHQQPKPVAEISAH